MTKKTHTHNTKECIHNWIDGCPIEMKDVHIEFDNIHNNDIQNGKLVYIIL